MNKQIVKGAIVTKFGSQCVAARELGLSERRLSRVLNGHEELKPDEVRTLEQRLGVALSGAVEVRR